MTVSARLLAREDVQGEGSDAPIARPKRLVAERAREGFPDLSPAEIQRQFVGSTYEDALDEARRFYDFARESMGDRAYRRSGAKGYLDFGCGWGRLGRFFLRDFQVEDMVGVDVDPDMVAFCARAKLPGGFETIVNGQPLPFADGSFRLITAHSAFTHLPPNLFRAWLAELLRVLAPGGQLVFTVEPPRVLDRLETADANASNAWTAKFVAKQAAPHGGEVVRYIDDPARFRQAAVVIRKRDPNAPRGFFARLLARLSGKA
jgi:SAM-dependent methyltransferase